jgi:alanine racemase
MNRVGVEIKDVIELTELIVASKFIKLEGAMTHLSVPADLNDPVARSQIDNFQSCVQDIKNIYPKLKHVHFGSSSAVLSGIATP